MDKFRKQYALQQKYRQSVTQQQQQQQQREQQQVQAPTSSESNHDKHNFVSISKARPPAAGVAAVTEKAKLYASSSITASTCTASASASASSSFDSANGNGNGDVHMNPKQSKSKSTATMHKLGNGRYIPKISNGNTNGHGNGNNDERNFIPYRRVGIGAGTSPKGMSEPEHKRIQKRVAKEQSQYHALSSTEEEQERERERVPIKTDASAGANRYRYMYNANANVRKFHDSALPQNPIRMDINTIKGAREPERTKVHVSLSQRIQQLDAKQKRDASHLITPQQQQRQQQRISPTSASASLSTSSRITQSHTNSNSGVQVHLHHLNHNHNHMAPTEAQLRWAQFHQKQRARETQALVEKLMQYPQFVQNVEGAQDGDGDSSNDGGSDRGSDGSGSGSECSYAHESNETIDMNTNNGHSHGGNGELQKIFNEKKNRERRQRRRRRKMKLKPSRGRRALLRVSARRTEERRMYISEHGYAMAPEDECSDNDGDDDDDGTHTSSHHQSATTMDDTLILDEITDALHVTNLDGDMSVLTDERTHHTDESIMIAKQKDLGVYGTDGHNIGNGNGKGRKRVSRKKTRVGRRLKGMRSMVRTADEEEERMKRFEDAYALMCSVGKEMEMSNNNESNIAKPKKRWSRASHIPVAVSIDGRVYDDLQRSPAFKHVPTSKRYGQEVVGAELNGSQLTDRGASWMVHLPKQDRRTLNFFGQYYTEVTTPSGIADDPHPIPEVISPSQLKLMEIVDRLQAHNSESSPSRSVKQKQQHHLQQQQQQQRPQAIINGGVEHPSDENSKDGTGKESHVKSTTPERKGIFKPPNLFVNTAVEKIKQQKILTPFKVGVSVKNMRNRFLGVKEEECTDDVSEGKGDGVEDSLGEEEQLDELDDFNEHQRPFSPSSLEAQKLQKVVAEQVKSGQPVIDTDNQSQISEGMDALQRARIGSLMLSPTILTKRLNQAISATEMCRWDQVDYLISANPWLAEMTDVNSEQFLLHKLAFHGGGTVGVEDGLCETAPTDLNDELINASMSSIHKFDINGNLPLHMAAEAGNEEMVDKLSKIFPGGASVRNNDGLLPLHLSVLACGNPLVNMPLRILSNILALFPAALAIADNEGNLPLHLATAYLTGDIGAHVVHILVDEAEKQGEALRFPTDIITLANIDDSASNVETDYEESNDADGIKSILFVKNSLGWNPLITAIQRGGGWEILEAILSREGIEHIAFERDDYGRSILQLGLTQEPCDPPSILSILKAVPDLVSMRDVNGALPIETACLHGLQSEVIMAIALLDLPIDLDGDEDIIRDGFGGSWWYLNCDCDDMFVHIIREILEICDYHQRRALCFTKNRKGNSLISRASPKCKHELRKTLRFDGRYEFVGSAIHSEEEGVKVFEALDFGTDEEPWEEGRRVIIKYYGDEDAYNRATKILRQISLVDSLFAEMRFFEATTTETHPHNNRMQRCIATESPILTLRTIVSSMAKKKYRTDQKQLDRYLSKTRKVFRMIGESICYLHEHGVVHGHLVLEFCGKFDDGWKLIDLTGAHNIGESMPLAHAGASAPPEAVIFGNGHGGGVSTRGAGVGRGRPSLREEITASPSLDIWAFGKLMYEVLVGDTILPMVDSSNSNDNTSSSHDMRSDEKYLHLLGNWNEESLKHVVADIEASGEGALAADLISHCLCPSPEHRPKNMQEVLSHAYWNTASSSNRRTNSAMRHHHGGGGKGIGRRFQA